MEDSRLLADYLAEGSQCAFEQLVSRHINLVYAAALRHVHDVHIAQDVTQAVFVLLAKKAASLRHETVLPAWLLTTTRYAALDALKLQARRRKHESRAAEMNARMQPCSDASTQVVEAELLSMLDMAMARLAKADQRAIVLRFYERKDFQDIGRTLGLTDEAARKRVTRATDKLRGFFSRRGRRISDVGMMSIGTTAWSRRNVIAPSHLSSMTVNAALNVTPAGGAGVAEIAHAVLRRQALCNIRILASAVAVLMLFSSLSGLAVHSLLTPRPAQLQSPVPEVKLVSKERAVWSFDLRHSNF